MEVKSWVRKISAEVLTLAALILLITVAARSAFADHYYVPSGSMEYTLVAGDRVIVDKTAYGLRIPFTSLTVLVGERPARGDVVVFDSPESGDRLIKRVVAVGGDHVVLRDGKLTIDGEVLEDPSHTGVERYGRHLVKLNLSDGGGLDILPMTVPPNMVLVLGDHRGDSRDSRSFGLIPEAVIYGRALAIYYRQGQGLTWLPL